MKNTPNQVVYEKRIQDRQMWVRLGWTVLVPSTVLLLGLTLGVFFGLPFTMYNRLIGVSLAGIILSAIFIVLFGRLGWSNSRLLDLLFNRLSIVLLIGGVVLGAVHAYLGQSLEPVDYTQIMSMLGFLLAALGIKFQSQADD